MKILLTVPILFLSLSTLVVSAFEAGGNYAPCRSNSNCATDRACRSFEVDLDVDDVGNVVSGLLQNIGLGGLSNPFSTLVQSATKPCEDDSDYCVCIPLKEDLIQCSSESDCSDGEDCLEKLCVASVQADAWRDPASCSSDSKCSSDTTCVKFEGNGICSARFKETTSSEKPGSGASNGTQSGKAGGNYAPCRPGSCANDRSCRHVDLDAKSLENVVPDTIDAALQSLGIENASNPISAVVEGFTKPCEDDSAYCICLPLKLDLVECSTDSACLDREECFMNVCIERVQADAWRRQSPCSSDSECSSDTTCIMAQGKGFCFARFKETTSSEKPNGTQSGNDADGEQEDDDDDDDDSEICIAVKSLRHLQPHQLVYQKHMTARVLCDKHGSCATAGHMVRYRGRAMMMKSYCELVGSCERSITKVNSPRYTRALQIPSESPDLTFTAFAARYATAAEEHVLRTAVHIGL